MVDERDWVVRDEDDFDDLDFLVLSNADGDGELLLSLALNWV